MADARSTRKRLDEANAELQKLWRQSQEGDEKV